MNASQDRRLWIVGGAVVGILILVLGWFVLISPKLSSTSSLRGQTADTELQNELLQTKVTKLQKEAANGTELTQALKSALEALPFDSGLPAYTRQLTSQAAAAQVQLASIVVGAVGPATSGGGSALVTIPVTLVSHGSAANQLAFLNLIQSDGPRRSLVLSSQIGPSGAGKDPSIDQTSQMTTQINVFSEPLNAAARAQLEKLLSGDFSN